MNPHFAYHDQKIQECTDKSKELLKGLPMFCTNYYNSKHSTSERTTCTYLRRINSFFNYIVTEKKVAAKTPKAVTLAQLKKITLDDLDAFIKALETGGVPGSSVHATARTVSNYISALNSLWDFLCKRGMLEINIIKLVERPKVKQETVDRKYLDENDVSAVFNVIESGIGLSKKTLETRTDVSVARDKAIYVTLLHTGLRVSELVGVDLEHLFINKDNKEPFVKIRRKEEYVEDVYLSDAAVSAINDYLLLRSAFLPSDSSEKALFISTKGKNAGTRLSVRSVENLIKKYAEAGAPMIGSHISPHRIRATYATRMINKTGDLSLVQQLMSHKNPATTAIYINDREEARKQHRNDFSSDSKAEI